MNIASTEVECRRCGTTGRSNCPICRPVFPKDERDFLWSYALKVKIEKREEGNLLKISYDVGNLASKKEGFRILLRRLRSIKYKDIDRIFCEHYWDFVPGEQSHIGCGHKRIDENENE